MTELTETKNIGSVKDPYAMKLLNSVIDFIEEDTHEVESEIIFAPADLDKSRIF